MTFWEAIALGIIQGLTEFLPVSSSGHLALAQYFFGMREPQLLFDVMLHVGTLGAIVAVFRRDILNILNAVFGREPAPHGMTRDFGRKIALLIVLGSVPTVIIALVFSVFVERLFVAPLFVSGMLFVTGIILWLSGRFRSVDAPHGGLNVTNALMIGIAQGFAVLPGISRSGATISTALVRGVDRQEAARYSLLLSVPAVLGATVLELKDISSVDVSALTIVAGTITAFVVGYLAIRVLLRELRKGNFSKFAYYCWGIGLVATLTYIVTR